LAAGLYAELALVPLAASPSRATASPVEAWLLERAGGDRIE
jgi:hypothetical protein